MSKPSAKELVERVYRFVNPTDGRIASLEITERVEKVLALKRRGHLDAWSTGWSTGWNQCLDEVVRLLNGEDA